jgi:inner membrane protein
LGGIPVVRVSLFLIVASVGHFAVGLLVGRVYETENWKKRAAVMGACGALALLPDADVAGVALGLGDGGICGHRGYSHSLLFAGAVTIVTWLLLRKRSQDALFAALLVFLAIASHGVLDAMTYTTRGIPFFWPLTDMRIAFPWRPIPPAPTGMDFLSLRGLEVAAIEVIYFAPLALAAFAPSRRWWKRRLKALARNPLPPAGGEDRGYRRQFTPARLVRLAAVVTSVAITIVAAQTYWRISGVVAWIERSTRDSVAVSLPRRSRPPLHPGLPSTSARSRTVVQMR